MRSGAERHVCPVVFATLVIASMTSAVSAAQSPAAPAREVSTRAFDDRTIARAIETVKAEPNLATERSIKTLRFKDLNAPKPQGRPAWFDWFIGLIRWIEQSARILVWCVAGMLVVLLAGYLVRLVRAREASAQGDTFVAPAHVQDLDIRPESLPDNVGAAARQLWDRGSHRQALSLLYRGLLSRLAHVHHVPIRDSSTEGDCLSLASAHLAPDRHQYVSRLIAVWQRAVYAHDDAATPTVYALCDEFAGALDRRPLEGTL